MALFLIAVSVPALGEPQRAWKEFDGIVGVPGERYEAGVDPKASARRARPLREDSSAPIALAVRLEPLLMPEQDEPEERKLGVPRRIGVHRQMPPAWRVPMSARDLEWEPVAGGGEVATLSLTSPAAVAVRLAIDFEVLPEGTEVRFYSPANPSVAFGPFTSGLLLPAKAAKGGLRRDPFWSPVIQGQEIAMEIFVPEWERGQDVAFALDRASHIYRPLRPVSLKGPDDSGSCNRNLSCSNKWQNSGDAVAMYIFESGGGTVQCTGQLIVDGDPSTQKRWFLTAAHCVNRKSEARTMTFFFGYQQQNCGGGSFSMTQTPGGATLKATTGGGGTGEGDHTLVLMKKPPPDGVTFQGISISGDHVGSKKGASIGHPNGDHKKIALLRKILGLVELDSDGFIFDGITHYEVRWKKRTTTEPGSSGASLMVGKKWPNQFLIGLLTGGFASCQALSEPDFYGSLAYVLDNFPKFAKALKIN